MKKILAAIGALLLWSATTTNAQHNGCVAGDGYTCTTAIGAPFSLSSAVNWPITCLGQQITLVASPTTGLAGLLRITHTNEECVVSHTIVPLDGSLIVDSSWVVTNAGTGYTESGSGLTAVFTPTVCGVGTLTFSMTYTLADVCGGGTGTVSYATSYTVVSVASLIPTNAAACGASLLSSNATLQTFQVPMATTGPTNLIILGTSCPTLTAAQLPSCWNINSVWTNRAYVDLTHTNDATVVCSSGTSAITNIIHVISVAPPVIVTQPASQTVPAGSDVTFSVVATGATPLYYQWAFKGTNIAGATNTNYVRFGVQLVDTGAYTVTVTNIAGSATSSNANLTVYTPTYTALCDSSLTNYVFQGDTTYYICGQVNLYGTTTIEGGAIIKFATNSGAQIIVNSNLVCATDPYHPAIFTAKDDNTVGLAIIGSTGVPTNYYGNDGLHLMTQNALSNLRFSYLRNAVESEWLSWAPYSFSNLQINRCQTGVRGHSLLLLYNVLVCSSGSVFVDPSGAGSLIYGAQLTLHDNTNFATDTTGWFYLTNSLIVTTPISGTPYGWVTNAVVIVTNSTNSVFQTVGAGAHYLNTNSPYRNAGVTTINPAYLADLRTKTTYPPLLLSSLTITNSTNWNPVAQRDTDTPDLGYHYDPIDYGVSNIYVTNATLTLTNGVVIAPLSTPAISVVNGTLDSEGSPKAFNYIVQYRAVQEQTANWGTNATTTLGADHSTIKLRFTDAAYLPTQLGHNQFMGISVATVTIQDSRLADETFFWEAGETLDPFVYPTVQFNNTLINRCYLDFLEYGGDGPDHEGGYGWYLTFDNDLFVGGNIFLGHSFLIEGGQWIVMNNFFDHVPFLTAGGDLGVPSYHNGYWGSATLAGTTGFDVTVTNFTYNNGPLGRYYQGATNLVNRGSSFATTFGLYHYTTQTNQVKETNSAVDIGLHYVALNGSGNLVDSDGDGIPDYVEDANGNGLVGGTETAWSMIIYSQPTNATITYGQDATFTVVAGGIAPLHYQWKKNGTNVTGATDDTLILHQPAVADSGAYSVTITNIGGSISSSNATLTVQRAPLTIRADNKSKMYHAANPALTWTAHGFVSGENISTLAGAPVVSTTATSNSNAGTYTITISSNTLSASNYTLMFTNGILTVVKVPLIITAQNKTKAYGAANPALTWTISGFVGSDGTNVLSGAPGLSTTATTGSGVGTYPIVVGAGTLSALNYTFGCVNGNLTVTTVALTVTANNTNRTYGAPNPTFTASYSGFVNGDTATVISGTPSLTSTAVSNSPVGTYTITSGLGSLAAANYSFGTFNNGTLTNTKSSLLVLADNKTKYVGETNPILTYTFGGLLAGDGSNVVSGAPVLTTANSNSSAGTYNITNAIGTLAATNYSFTLSNGQLTVLAPVSLLSFSNSAMNYLLGSPPAVMDSGMQVTPKGSVTFSNAILTAGFVASQQGDHLSVLNFGTSANQINVTNITNGTDIYQINYGSTNVGSFSPGSPTNDLVIHFRTNATATYVQAVARCLTYYNTATNPFPDIRHVRCCVTVTNVGSGTNSCPQITNTVTPLCPTNIYAILVIDKTTSMTNTDVHTTNAYGSTRLAAAKNAAVTYLGYPQFPVDRVMVYSFCGETNASSNPTLETTNGFGTNLIAISNAIAGISSVCDNTVYHPSLHAAYTNLASITNLLTLRLVFFLTDGELSPAASSNYDNYSALAQAETHAMSTNGQANQSGIRIVTIGVGGDIAANDSTGQKARALLTLLASSPDDFHISTNGTGLTSVYTGLASAICRTTNLPPIALAGPDMTNVFTSLPATINLTGYSYDQDNLPIPHQVTNLWTKTNGPTGLTFGNATVSNTTITVTQPGTNVLQLVASDTALSATDTVTIVVQVVSNAAPSVFIVTPLNGQAFNAPAKVTVTSVAQDTTGVVTNLAYYTNGVYWTNATTPPYQLVLSNQLAGSNIPRSLQFTAVAMSSSGLNGTSAAVTVSINPQPPTVAITSPVSNAVFALGEPIVIQASAGDVDGVVTNVQFKVGTTVLGNDTNAPYVFTWTNGLLTASNTLIVIATDNDGLKATSSVPILSQSCAAPGVSNLILSVSQITGGLNLTGTVVLSNAATTGGQAVNLYSTSAVVTVPTSVYIPEGQISNSFTITTASVNTTNLAAVVAAYHAQNPPRTNSLTIVPDASTVFDSGDTNDVSGLVTQDLTVLTPEMLVREIVGPDVAFSNIQYTGASNAAGLFRGGNGIIGFSSGLILSSGDVANVVGPNNSSGATGVSGTDGDEDLDAVAGVPTLDAAVLEFDFVPVADTITWDYVFGSEEYNEYVNAFNDVFAFFLNGTNVALLPDGSGVAINNVNNSVNSEFYRDNAQGDRGGDAINSPFNTQLDGLTTVLSVSARVIPGVTNHIKLAIADALDQVLDSDVLIRTRSFKTGGTVIYTRDDQQRQYAPFTVIGPQLGTAAPTNSSYDLHGLWGNVAGERFKRAGAVGFTSGSRFDFEIGVGSLVSNNVSSFGILYTNAQLLTSTNHYSNEWELPAGFYPDAAPYLGGTYHLRLTNRVSSACGQAYSATDTPQAAWPLEKNILTLAVATERMIPQGRCSDFLFLSGDAPVNGTWDIVFRNQVIASSGQPNGWDVEDDYTWFGGLTVTVPTNAAPDSTYQVRVQEAGWAGGRSTIFEVLPAGSVISAPLLLPLVISTNMIAAPTNVSLRVSLDAPAPFGDAYVPLYTNGTFCLVAIVPAGQTATTVSIPVNGSTGSTVEIFASYNGYRKAKVRIVGGSCVTPDQPSPSGDPNTIKGAVVLTWAPITNASSYTVSRGLNGINFVPLFTGLTTNRFVDTAFVPGTNYSYMVIAFTNWCSSTGVSASVSTPFTGPAPAPWIIPLGGIYNDQVTVQITNYVPGAVIFYTTNGTTPTYDLDHAFTNGGTLILATNTIIKAYTYQWLSNMSDHYESDSRVITANFTVVHPAPINCGDTLAGSLTHSNAFSTAQGPGYFSSRFAFTAGSGDVGKLATVTASSANFDTFLIQENATGNVVAWNDDYTNNVTDSRISFRILHTGTNIFEVTSYSQGETGDFSIQLDCQTITSPGLNVFTNAYPVFTTNSALLPIGGSNAFGNINSGTRVTNYITLTNSGNGNLTISNIAIYPNAATNGSNGFSIYPTNNFTLAPGAVTNLAVVLYSTTWSSFSGYFSFMSNDGGTGNNSPQSFFYAYLSGQVNPPTGPPYVQIYYPTNGTTVPATNSTITNVTLEIDAIAMDMDGIQKVEFYTNYPGSIFQTVSNVPYTIYWTNPPAGTQTITVIAYDASPSHLSRLTNVTITVGAPSLVLTPSNACVGLSNTTFTVTATLRDVTNGLVNGSNVLITVNGAHILSYSNNTSSGQINYTYTGTNAGLDTITASAVVAGVPVTATAILKNWARVISCGTTNSGVLTNSDGTSIACGCAVPSHYTDFYSYTGTAGQVVTFKMTSTNFSTYMFLMGSNCSVIAITNESLNPTDTQFRTTLPSNGTYFVEATSADSFKTGGYSLSLFCGTNGNVPDIAVSVNNTNVPNYGIIDLGTTTNGTAITRTLSITNKGSGTGTLTISNAGWYYGQTNLFSFTPALPISLAVGAGTNITVQFLSTNSGQFVDALMLTNNDPDENPFVINFSAISNPDGTPPTVSITSPTNNAVFVAPATINIQALATNSAGTAITNVVFLYRTALGTNFIGKDPTYPYSYSWNIATPGNYDLLAVAYDSLGHIAVSAPITNIQVRPSNQNHPPVAVKDYPVVLSNSKNNILDVLTNDYDPDGDALTITQVILASTPGPHGTVSIVNGGKKLSYTPPSGYGSPDPTQIEDGFTYEITDGKGGTNRTGVFVAFYASPLPQITIINPPDGSVLNTGTFTNLAVSILPSEVLPNVVMVQFFAGEEMFAVITNAPFTNYNWLVRQNSCNCPIKARVFDKFGQLADSPTVSYTIQPPPGSPVPYGQIDSPAVLPFNSMEGANTQEAVVEDGLLTVTGSVYQVTFAGLTNGAEYTVRIKAEDGTVLRDSGWLTNATPLLDVALYTNDLTTLQNDRYELELLVRNNYQTVRKSVMFLLQSNLKIGVFTFSEQDLVIPAGGVPLSVVRTYNSMNPKLGDFGYSWTYTLNGLDVTFHENRTPQCPLDVFAEGPAYSGGKFSLRVSGSRDMTLTLPDGRRTTFLYYEEAAQCSFGDEANLCAVPKYYAPPDVHYTLQAVDENGGDLGGYDMYLKIWQKGGGETAHEAFDFPAFLLTDTSDGTQYFLLRDLQGEFAFLTGDCGGDSDEDLGGVTDSNFYVKAYGAAHLAWIKRPSGEKIVINAPAFNNGGSQFSIDFLDVTGHNTRSIYFQRNAQGQIAAIMDPVSGPNGLPIVKYEYDGNLNLTRVIRLTNRTGPVYTTNTYLYENGAFPHYITKILDPRGVPAARNLFDDDGKLIGIIDALGKTNLFVHDPNGHTETVFDRMGNPTIYSYDTRGNVMSTIDALGHMTQRTFDDQNNVASETDALTNTIYYSYDANGNCTSRVDPLGRTNLMSYDSNGNLSAQTDPLGNLGQNLYDSNGKLTNSSQYDAQGDLLRQTSSTYNNGRLAATYNGTIAVSTFGYDDAGNLTSTTNASGFVQNSVYDADGNQVSSSYIGHKTDGTAVTIATTNVYDGAGRVTVSTDASGNTNFTSYNALGKVDHTVDSYNNTNSYLYDARGNLIQMISPFGTNLTVFDDNNHPILALDRNGIRGTLTQYDQIGRSISTIKASNVVINVLTDPINPGLYISVIGSLGVPYSTNSVEYYDNGTIKSKTAPNGGKTSYQYYADGHTMTVTDPLNHTTSSFYDEGGRQTAMVDAASHITRFVYDAPNQKTMTIYADGSSVTNEFDILGQRVGQVDQAGLRTQFAYGVSGLLTNVIKPTVYDAESGNPSATPQWKYQYDEHGYLLVTTDPKGHSTTNKFDELGRQSSHSLMMGQTVSNLFNSKGQLWKQYDCKGQWTEFVYDNFGRTKAKFLFNVGAAFPSNSVCYQYNALGQLAHIIERYDQDATTNTCDGYTAMVGPRGGYGGGNGLTALALRVPKELAGGLCAIILLVLALMYMPHEKRRLLAICLTEAWRAHQEQEVTASKRVRLAALGWRVTAVVTLMSVIASDPHFDRLWTAHAQCSIPSNSSNLTTRYTDFTYDIEGHITQINTPEGVLNYGYDMATGQHISTCTANSYITYGYDLLNRLKTVTISKRNGASITAETTTYTYDAVGNRSTVLLPNNILTSWKYDALNRLTNVTQMAGVTNLATYNYQLHITGRRTNAIEVVLQEGGAYLTNVMNWQYDGLYRLTNEVSVSSATSGNYTNAFQYDLAGNRYKQVRTAGTNVTITTNLFDANDELLREVSQVNGLLTDTNSYAYDANGSVTAKTNVSGTIIYTYNVANKLSSVNVAGSTTSYQYNDQGMRVRSITSASTKYYLVDANNRTGYAHVLEELDNPGGAPSQSYVLGDEVLGQCGSTTSDPRWLLYDGHGSTRQLADKNMAVTSHYSYEAYGLTQSTSTASAETSMLYSGEQYDSALKMYNLRARFYNPSNGRFNSMDTSSGENSDPQSLHKYNYTYNDPINGMDPSGHDLVECLCVVAVISILAAIILPALNLKWAGSKVRRAMASGPPSAYVVSLEYTGIFAVKPAGIPIPIIFGGDGGIDLLYVKKMARWYAFGFVGPATGWPGQGVSLAAGPVWYADRASDYLGWFFSTSLGGTGAGVALGKSFGIAPGGVFSVFWSPQINDRLNEYCCGFKVGPQLGIGTKPSITYSFAATYYIDISNWPGVKSIVDYFNSQVVAPVDDDPNNAQQFAGDVQSELAIE